MLTASKVTIIPTFKDPVISNDVKEKRCVVCLEMVPDVCFVPCGHVCLCIPCVHDAQKFASPTKLDCAVCQQKVDVAVETIGL